MCPSVTHILALTPTFLETNRSTTTWGKVIPLPQAATERPTSKKYRGESQNVCHGRTQFWLSPHSRIHFDNLFHVLLHLFLKELHITVWFNESWSHSEILRLSML